MADLRAQEAKTAARLDIVDEKWQSRVSLPINGLLGMGIRRLSCCWKGRRSAIRLHWVSARLADALNGRLLCGTRFASARLSG
jgi:hypothetical protein